MLRLFFSYFVLLIIVFFCDVAYSQQSVNNNYLKAVAQKGDGIYVLLGRYNLDRSDCSFDHFCKINNLKRNSNLELGKTYKLPILKYFYNQKSIRSTANIEDWQQAKQIERYNDLMVTLGRKNSDFRLGSRELWVPHHLQNCAIDLSAFVPQNRNFPILGKKYADVPLLDQKLAGAVYYIVSGHGGPDPGAMAKYEGKDLCEDEYAYDIALRLGRNLLAHGAIVYFIIQDNDGIRDTEFLTPDFDERCYPNQIIPITQKERLNQRSNIVNQLYDENRKKGIEYQRLIEVHIDSRVKSKRVDLFFYHYPTNQTGRALAAKLHEMMQKKYAVNRKSGEYHGTISARDLHVLREVKPVPVFIEVGNIQNPNDQKRILYPSNRQALADWLAEGLLLDY